MRTHSNRKDAARKPVLPYRLPLRNDHLSAFYGLPACEALLLVYADEDREPRDGERVFMHYARAGGGCGCIGSGLYRREADGGFSVTHEGDGSAVVNSGGDTHYPESRRYLMRVVGYVRDGGQAVWLDPEDGRKWAGVAPGRLREPDAMMSEEEYVAEFGCTWEENMGFDLTRDRDGRLLKPKSNNDDRRARVNALKARLGRLDASDEITTCSARFKLEKQIFDLEYPVDLDDWSAWEEGGGR